MFYDIIKLEKERFKNEINNRISNNIVNETKITEVSDHLIDRIKERKLNIDDIEHTLKNPLKYGKITYYKDDRPSFSAVGEKCTVYVNPDNGIITTIHKTHTKTVEKLKQPAEKQN